MASSIALDSTAQDSFNKSVKNLIKNEKLRKGTSAAKQKKGIVYIKHIPHGFYEEQMKGYFGQFGTVTNVKLARSKKSGKSKGFAFIEFEYEEVAQVVAETMNNYIMCNRLLKAEYIPQEKINGKNFWKTNITAKSYPRLRNWKRDVFAKNAEKSEDTIGMLLRKRRQHVEGIIEKLNARGISYSLKEFDAPAKEEPVVLPQTPVLEIDESDEEIEFTIRPNVRLRRTFLKKSKKSSSAKQKKTGSSTNDIMSDGTCRSPEPKLHLMDVKKNLFGNYESSGPVPGGKLLEQEHVNAISTLSNNTPLHQVKSANKVPAKDKNKSQTPEIQVSSDAMPPGKGITRKSVKPKNKKMPEKFSARLQKKLTRSRTARQDGSADDSAVDKFAKKLKHVRKSTSSKNVSSVGNKKFSSKKKMSLKGKLQGFVDLGM